MEPTLRLNDVSDSDWMTWRTRPSFKQTRRPKLLLVIQTIPSDDSLAEKYRPKVGVS